MQAIAFTGPVRSGKDTAADYLVEKHGFKKIVMSDFLGEELAKQGRPDTKMERSIIGKELRQKFGKGIVARKSLEKAKGKGFEKVVFAGPRSIAEIGFFKKKLESFKLIAIKAGPEKRFARKSSQDEQTKEKFFERDKWEKEKFEISQVIEMADHTIENNSTIDDFHRAIDEAIQKI